MSKAQLFTIEKNYTELVGVQRRNELEFLSRMFWEPDKTQILKYTEKISVKNFKYFPKHFEVMVQYKIHGREYDEVSAGSGLYLTDVLLPVYKTFEEAEPALRESSRSMDIYKGMSSLIEKVGIDESTKVLSESQRLIATLSSEGDNEDSEIQKIMKTYSEVQEENKKRGNTLLGFPCGIKKLDDAISGIRPSHLWIIGGYTSVGKTFFSLNVILSVLKVGGAVTLYSLEMSKVDLVSRILSIISAEEGIEIVKGKTNPAIEDAKKFLNSSKLRVYNQKRELGEIATSIAEQKIVHNVDVVVVDYLQQIEVDGADSEYESMSASAKEFQKVAERLNLPIIALSQVSNEAAKSPNSGVMGFKGAGTIASAADFAIELVPDENNVEDFRQKSLSGQPVNIKAIIKKNRHGRTGAVLLSFEGKTGRFMDRLPDMDLEFKPKKEKVNQPRGF